MPKLKPTKKSKPEVHKPKRITIGELVYRQMREDHAKFGTMLKAQQPYFEATQDALEKVRLIGEALNKQPQLWDSFRKAAEIERQLSEPMRKLAEPMRQLNEHLEKLKGIGTFRLSPALTEMIKNISKLPIPELLKPDPDEMEIITYSPPPITVVKNQLNNLESKLEDFSEQIKNTVTEQFDKLAERSIINAGYKEQIVYCGACNAPICKVKNPVLYTLSIRSQICPKCNKRLEQPRDFKIKDI